MNSAAKPATGLLVALIPVLSGMSWESGGGAAHNKSWIYVDASAGGRPLVSGDPYEVVVEYYLDPSEHSGTTTLSLWGTGPWIDTPDGKYAKKRGHIGYPGLSGRLKISRPGRGRHVFRFTVPRGLEGVRKNNRLLFVCRFLDASGKSWPWHVRANNMFVRRRGFFEIETGKPGNLFAYQEAVRVTARLKNVTKPGEKKTLRYTVHDTRGTEVARGTRDFTVEREGQEISIDLNLKRRGALLVRMEVDGWEKRHATLARIPDLAAITGGKPTRFGMTTHGSYYGIDGEIFQVARKLGLTYCRRFSSWNRMEPGPGIYRLEELEKQLALADRYGIRLWVCLVKPPAWILDRGRDIGYSCFEFKDAPWRAFVRTVSTRFKGRLYGWEWLNEITPGGSTPMSDYVRFCRIGTETAKRADPELVCILAGGLFPRSYRIQALTAGVGKYVDVLPVHYQNGDGIVEARADLDAFGLERVAVWEDESARGINAWGVPPLEELQNTEQCAWVLDQWTDELAAGSEKIIYFGGTPSAAGSHGYVLDDMSPRPVAATVAVFVGKLFQARPLGIVRIGRGGLIHLFERNGRAVLVASSNAEGGETVDFEIGAEQVRITDYQGNERTLACPDGKAKLPLGSLRVFVEGADLDVVKAYGVPSLRNARVSAGSSAYVAAAKSMRPRVTLIRGREAKMEVQLRNPYDRGLAGRVLLRTPAAWGRQPVVSFSLAKGEVKTAPVPIVLPDGVEARDYEAKLIVAFESDKLPELEQDVVLAVISPERIGNLMANGDFELPGDPARGPEGWRVNNRTKLRVGSKDLGIGLGRYVLKFQNSPGRYEYVSRSLPLRAGQTYLYTAWVWNRNMSAGSNMTVQLADGRKVNYYDVGVFTTGPDNDYWQLFTCRKTMPAGTRTVSFTPLVKGGGSAYFDNIRVSLFEGSDYAAEAYRTSSPPRIDGNLGDWIKHCPLPLIGRNQLTVKNAEYEWRPQNLNGIAYLMWDEKNLYVALQVWDDVHKTVGTGEATVQGDGVILGIDPTQRAPAAQSRGFAYYLSAASPGRGGARFTLYRPKKYSGGLRAGHLFGDSSIYEIAIRRSEGECVYEVRIPLGELGGVRPRFGGKIGFSVQINDNDGAGLGAHMNWGGGLAPAWRPGRFGIVTFVEK